MQTEPVSRAGNQRKRRVKNALEGDVDSPTRLNPSSNFISERVFGVPLVPTTTGKAVVLGKPNVMRFLRVGLLVAIVMISLVAFGRQILDDHSPNSVTNQRVVSLTRVPFTKRDLERQKSESYIAPEQPKLEPTSSWYGSLLRLFTGIFGDEQIPLESDPEFSQADEEPVRRGFVNFLMYSAPTSKVTRESGNSMEEVDIGSESDLQQASAHLQVSTRDPESANDGSLLGVAKNDGYVANIDKIKGIDLALSEMHDDSTGGKTSPSKDQDTSRSIRQRDTLVKCSTNKFDRLIAQKISLNDLSRPIITSSGRFDNPFSTWSQPSLVDAFKFMVLESDESNVPKNNDELEKELPLLRPNFQVAKDKQKDFRVTWIGHSTLVIQIDGMSILTDPIFSDRASPMQFFGPKRIREPACKIRDLPQIDAVIISHNHYDHLDADSIAQINDRFGSKCRWIVPLGLGSFMKSMSVKNYVELDWWQKDCFRVVVPENKQGIAMNNAITTTTTNQKSPKKVSPFKRGNSPTRSISNDKAELNIYLTPSQHWSRRSVNDVNKSLWGSYTIVSANGSTFFFGGDTGYCSAFKEVAKIFGPITGAAIPIGAYKPRCFLKPAHVDPQEATQIHRDLKSMKSIAIHHSTFVLSNEHYKEPVNLLRETMSDLRAKQNVKEPFVALKHGETAYFCKNCSENKDTLGPATYLIDTVTKRI